MTHPEPAIAETRGKVTGRSGDPTRDAPVKIAAAHYEGSSCARCMQHPDRNAARLRKSAMTQASTSAASTARSTAKLTGNERVSVTVADGKRSPDQPSNFVCWTRSNKPNVEKTLVGEMGVMRMGEQGAGPASCCQQRWTACVDVASQRVIQEASFREVGR